MTPYCALLLVLACSCHVANAQIKTQYPPGIKTHYPSQNSGYLDADGGSQDQYNNYYGGGSGSANLAGGYDFYNGNYRPAETYQGGQYMGTRPPQILDATAEFINKTRATMATGICHKEVPTYSLAHDHSATPRGNGSTPNMSRIQVCCDGYERNPHVYVRCDPVCKDDCPNGICTAPNTCVCIPGHVRDHENKCISVCPIGCGNGVCDRSGQCLCNPGYTLDPETRKFCVPHCEHGCQYGKCVSPNKCDCTDGYHLTGTGACEPRCSNCDNGQCTTPGYCSCNSGYQKMGGTCEPVCTRGCNKGRCIAPEKCECPSGYEWDAIGFNCAPHCDQPCLNGVCDGNNVCVCNAGYILDDIQKNVCKAHCPNGCPNGFCTSPNFCVCKPGFIKSGIKGRQTCVPA